MTIKYKCRYCHLVMTTRYGAQSHRCALMPSIPVDTPTPDNAFSVSVSIDPFSSSDSSSSDSFSGGGGDFGGGGSSGDW